jgi:small subunit ribosomal protein S26e|tara:strand:+ start:172 stop:564 length:393 start_codon:yes stop_codon:yes gene_type:complete
MVVKRRNHGRNKKNRGNVTRVACCSSGKLVPKDKAIKRFVVRNIVDASSLRDIKEAQVFEDYQMPKFYMKQYYCVDAAVHRRLVRVRKVKERRNRVFERKRRPFNDGEKKEKNEAASKTKGVSGAAAPSK